MATSGAAGGTPAIAGAFDRRKEALGLNWLQISPHSKHSESCAGKRCSMSNPAQDILSGDKHT